jgi:APA family basic amino acid/polyamine antiporter
MLLIGAVPLALLFGRLARRSPVTRGLYVYPRDAFRDFAGFLSTWSYWTMCWVSIVTLAVAVVGYVEVLMSCKPTRGGTCPRHLLRSI